MTTYPAAGCHPADLLPLTLHDLRERVSRMTGQDRRRELEARLYWRMYFEAAERNWASETTQRTLNANALSVCLNACNDAAAT